ncbi:hypothetical protein M9435_001781 [Picochlorum sp. BPE23]|nr:hypothetical protein M9435_001781 [Picochlorum sp. BPE23]
MQSLVWNYIVVGLALLHHKGVRAQVPGAVQIDPQNDVIDNLLDALGIDAGGDQGPLVDRWYFWLIIAVVILLFIVAMYFTIRGFMRHARNRKENQITSMFKQPKFVHYFDTETEEYIKEVGRRTGRPPERIAQKAAAVKDISVTPDPTTVIVDVKDRDASETNSSKSHG